MSVGSSEFSDSSKSSSSPKASGNSLEISPHTSERELRVIESETSSTMEILQDVEDEVVTISTPRVSTPIAQPKSILKSEKKEIQVKDASCQVFF